MRILNKNKITVVSANKVTIELDNNVMIHFELDVESQKKKLCYAHNLTFNLFPV